jgi:hypothetical protein
MIPGNGIRCVFVAANMRIRPYNIENHWMSHAIMAIASAVNGGAFH